MSETIVAQDVTKSFARDGERVEVLKGVSLAVAAGELVSIAGPSGVGKSTLLHLLGGLERPTGGKISYGETNLAELTDLALARFRNRHAGFVFQFHHLLPEFSAVENVMLPLLIRRATQAAARERAAALLGRVGLSGRLRHRPGELSGGEQQRVAIARALANEPRVVLADEPTGNLDPATSESVFKALFELCRVEGVAALVATHNMELARFMDRVFGLKDGHLTPRDLR
jgi:lipoprotein-releasing system ATP-binding protein